MTRLLEGKVAMVTGAGRGIGRATALLMAQEGARILAVDNGSLVNGRGSDPGVVQRVVEEIRERGGDAMPNAGDVARTDAAEAMVAQALDTWGRLDILVAAAGNFRLSTIADIEDDDWDEVITTHLRGTFVTTRAAVRHWLKAGTPGRIITFTSAAGTMGLPNMVSYSTAKAGIIGFTRACANSLVNYGITANAISPRAATRMSDRSRGVEGVDTFKTSGKWPSGHDGPSRSPANVAPLLVYLATDAAANVTGRTFGAGDGRFSLISEPVDERAVLADGPWDMDELCRVLPTTLTEGLSPAQLARPLESLDLLLEGDYPHDLLG